MSSYKYKALKINGKKIDEHRHVMQITLGRKLLTTEIVRHKDRDTKNNDPENLYVITRQQQVQEQILERSFAPSVLKAIDDRNNGIKKPRKQYRGDRKYIPKVKTTKQKKPEIAYRKESLPKKEKVYDTKRIDTLETYPLKVNKRTTIYIKKNLSQSEVDKIIKKYNK